MARNLTSENFDTTIKGSPVVLVDFWAVWCGPCRAMAPVLDEIAKRYEGRVLVTKVNVGEERELAVAHKIASIPTLKLFVDGIEVAMHVGATPIDKIVAWLDSLLPSA